MLKERTGKEVTTRCGTTIKINSTKAIDGIGVTGWEKRVTCEGCKLPLQV